LYWLCALLAILWLRPKLRRRPAYWDSREKGFASVPRKHNEAQTSALAIFMLDTGGRGTAGVAVAPAA